VWCTHMPIYVRQKTLVIPTIFMAWTGDALGFLQPMIRSSERLSAAAVRMLRAIGGQDAQEVDHVWSSLGCEQEYFLVDRGLYMQRPDLVATGRAIFGRLPAKSQQLDDHYFGSIPPRVLAYMQETERELWRYGVPVKTRHNEVAPGQFETAPIFEESTVAIAHNNLEMNVMQTIARRHGLEMLLHEKPFGGVNGSGKHNNYSFCTNTGVNLFEPTANPIASKPFLAALAATIRAVDVHPDMLRASIAVYGNDFRLGAAEAPPAIMSIFLGSQLEDVVQGIVDGELIGKKEPSPPPAPRKMNLTHNNPAPVLHTGDRNRTSPMAFTGNKFEFRAVGSSQNCCLPMMVINTITAESMEFIATEIETRVAAGGLDRDAAFGQVVTEIITKHRRVVFNGDGYSEEWVKEAEARGLPNLRSAAEAIDKFTDEKNVALFRDVLSEAELAARREVALEQYTLAIDIEAKTAVYMAKSMILPCAQRRQTEFAKSVSAVSAVAGIDISSQKDELKSVVETVTAFAGAIHDVETALGSKPHNDAKAEAFYMRNTVFPKIEALRNLGNTLEVVAEDRDWPLPTFAELLFSR
jgi:glutamine synthetase